MTRVIRALQVSLNLRSDNSTQCIRSKYRYWNIF